MGFVIIGASAAGIAAAKKIRQLQPQSEITVVSRDDRVYSRVKLHQYLSGEKDAAGIGFVAADFFEANRITWLGGVAVRAVDTQQKTVHLENGQALPYEKLLIASGADAFIPPIPHFREAQNVFGLRTIFDAEKIIAAAEKGKQCVIVGSGLVGLDAASALARRGVAVTLVEMADRLSPLQLDQHAAEAYQRLFEEQGCRFFFSVKAAGAEVSPDGNVSALLLEDGRSLPCDFLVAAAGVRSTTAFLEGSGIAADRGITVDAHLRTTAPDVYAAGDAAGIIGFWMGATKQGEVAAQNMCGEALAYEKEEPRNTLNYYGLATVSMGGALPEDGEQVIHAEGRNYRRVTVQDGKVVHVLLQGDISKAMMWQKIVQEGGGLPA